MGETAWLEESVRKAKEKYQLQRTLEERLAQEEARKRELGAKYCRDLFAWFERIEESFNGGFGGHVLAVSVGGADSNRSVQVFAHPTRTQERLAVLTYTDGAISLGSRSGSGATAETAQALKLVLSNDGRLLAEFGAEQYSYEQLGQKIIDDLLS